MRKIKDITILALVMIMCWSCVDSDRFDVIIDDRANEIGDITLLPVNPATGVAYSTEELAALDYDPTKEEQYFAGQPIQLNLWTMGKPIKLEVKKFGDPTVIATITNYVEQDGGYLITWVSTVEELGITEGSLAPYNFLITYDDAGTNGFDYSTVKIFPFKIFHKTAKAEIPFAVLQSSVSNITGLTIESNATGIGIEEGIGAYVELDGVDDFVTITQPLDFVYTEDFSFSFWVNTTSPESDPAIIGNKDWNGGGNRGFVLAHRGKDVKLNVGDGNENGNRVDIKGQPINDGNWHHIACTFDRDGKMSLYQDGVLFIEDDISHVGEMNSEMPIRIGQDGTGTYGQFFEGKVGGLVINDYVLSSGEVKLLAGKGTGAQLRTQSKHVALEVENGATETITELGMPVSVYDGIDDYSTIIDNGALDFRFDQDFSFAVWVKTTSTGDDPSIIGDKDWNGGGNKGFVLAFRGTKDVKLNVGDGNGNRVDVKGPAINDGEWHLVMATFDRDGSVVLYQDGVAVASENMAVIGDMNSEMPIRIAQDGTGTYGKLFEGKVGRTMIFDYVVSADEALMLFQE